jgi:HAD superfamily hydrolase (TIGR01484 family)
LLNEKEEIPKEIIEKIKFISKCIPVSLASGRIFSSVLEYSTLLGLTSPQISDNGAIIFDPQKNNKIIFRESIDCSISTEIFDLLDKNNFYYFASADGETLDRNSIDKANKNVNIITCIHDDVKEYLSISNFLDNSKISLVLSTGSMDEKYISFMPKNINKSIAIKEYAKVLKLNKSEIFALGDGPNDIEMLDSVGVSVAMGNSVKEVFEVSKFYTDTYKDCGTENVLDWIIKSLYC